MSADPGTLSLLEYYFHLNIMVGTENAIAEAELGTKMDLSHEEVVHMAELTEEEKVVEKKLRRRIDALIMPLAILVYLMNYIDR
jgi:hypothetical protein